MDIQIQDLFLNKHGTFNRILQFEVIIIIASVVLFFTKYFTLDKAAFFIIILSFGIYIANIYVTSTNQEISDSNEITMFKLKSLQKTMNDYITKKIELINKQNKQLHLSKEDLTLIYNKNKLDALYIDATMIHFLYSIIKLNDYNPQEFHSLLLGTNNILKIRLEIEEFLEQNNNKDGYPENIAEMFEIALQLRSNTINNVHNFIYTAPKVNRMYKYINNVIERYSVLISRNTDIIHSYYKNNLKQKPITTATKFISYNKTKPFDANVNHSILVNETESSKLIPFYI